MSDNQYVLDVIVTNLELSKDLKLSPEDVFAEFKWNDILLPITASRINTANFVPNRGVEFSENAKEMRASLTNKDFKLTIFRKGEEHQPAEIVGKSKGMEELIGYQLMRMLLIIGECYCEWPQEATTGGWPSDKPLQHTCDLFKHSEYVGTVTVNMSVLKKCRNIAR